MKRAIACRECYQPHSVPMVREPGTVLKCQRCGAVFESPAHQEVWRLLALVTAWCALILWPFAVFVPMLEKVQRGPDSTYSVWEGATIFFRGHLSLGAVIAGIVVFSLAVVYTPLKNLATIWFAWRGTVPRLRPRSWRAHLRALPRRAVLFVNHHFTVVSLLEVCVLGFTVMAFFDKSPFRLILGPGLIAFIALFAMTVTSKIAYHRSHLWDHD